MENKQRMSIAKYMCQFQEVESQLPPEDMGVGHCMYMFLTHLSKELYMQLIHHRDWKCPHIKGITSGSQLSMTSPASRHFIS